MGMISGFRLPPAMALTAMGVLAWTAGCSDNLEEPLPATHLRFVAQPHSIGVNDSFLVQVEALDDEDRRVTSYAGEITIALQPNAEALVGVKSLTAENGVATFSGLRINQAGSGYTLQAAASGLAGASSNGIEITPPGPVASIMVLPASATLLTGANRQLSATARDPNGNVLPGRLVTWASEHPAAATVDPAGLVTGIAEGSATIIATSEGVSDTATIAVTATPSVLASVSTGIGYACGLSASGAAYCWGTNRYGQLGDGSTSASSIPVPVTGGRTFYEVAVGYSQALSCGLITSGEPYCWGRWANGFSSDNSSSIPVAVPGGHEFVAVTVGSLSGPPHACGLTVTGAVYCWGANAYGQLGDGTGDGPDYCYGWRCRSVPVRVVGDRAFIEVSAGGEHACGVTIDRTAYCWGYNSYGQLGNGSTTSSAVPVAVSGGHAFITVSAGAAHTCGATTSGKAYCWGANGGGQLGDGSITYQSVPVAVSGGLTFSSVSARGYTCGVTTTGAAHCWGGGNLGSLGTGEEEGPDQCEPAAGACSRTPVAVAGGLTFARLSTGSQFSCGITVGGVAYCWGSNTDGQLGDGHSPEKWRTPEPVLGGLTLSAITAGWWYTCGLTTSQAAHCWGDNYIGQLGDGSTDDRSTPVAVSGGVSFSALAAGPFHNCGLTSAGAAYCWGYNGRGQLGDGSTTDRLMPVAVLGGLKFNALAASFYHTCGLKSSGEAYCWGRNEDGELGDGSTTDHSTPVAVSGGLSFSAIAAGFRHTCGLAPSGAAHCWGANAVGQLGNGSPGNSPTPVAVSGGLTFSALAAGAGHSCGLTSPGATYCWGSNYYGELGDGSTTARSTPVTVSGSVNFSALDAGADYTCGLTGAGAAHCWGSNDHGQLGDGSTTNRSTPVAVAGGLSFSALTAGGYHTCGLGASGAAWCWGDGLFGQLGRGTFGYSTIPVAVAPF